MCLQLFHDILTVLIIGIKGDKREMTLLSFVIPCYRSEQTIERVIDEIEKTVGERENYDYEVIAVNDCSPDNVYEILSNIARTNKKIKVINFAKNMGKHSAVLAGHSYVSGEYVVDIDDDYQSPTNCLWKLLEPVINDECDVATASYPHKKESLLKRMGSDFNAYMGEKLFNKKHGLRFENFIIMKRFVSDEIIRYKNPFPYLEGLILGVTKRIKMVEMEQRERGDDKKSGFTLKKSFDLFANGMTAFSTKPLRAASVMGFMFSFAGILWGIVLIVKKLINPKVLIGYTSTAVIMLVTSGIIMYLLGMIGEYIGRIYICLNNIPQYVIKETINIEDDYKNVTSNEY